MKDDQYVSVMNYKAKDPRESEMTHRKFKDLCNFSKDNVKCYQKKDNMNIPEVSLFINKQLILALNLRCYIYDFKTNSMKNFPNVKYDHEGGSMIYCGYDNCIYIIAGKSTSLMEKIKFNSLEKRNIGDWEVVSDSGTIRSYFCTFLINNKVIYLLLGYDPRSKKYLTSINRYDTALGEWSNVTIDETKSPRLSYASVIHFCDGGVFIVGGLKNYHEANGTVYLFSYSNCEWKATDFHVQDTNLIKDENVSEESEDNNNQNNYEKKEESYNPTMRFSSNCQFIPLKFNAHDSMSSFFYAQFDNANYCHLINVRSFDHYILFQNDLVEFEEQSMIEEENEYDNSMEKSEKTISNKKKDLMAILENDEVNDNDNIIKSNYNINFDKKENSNNKSINNVHQAKNKNNMIEEDEDDDSVVDELEVEDEDDHNTGNQGVKKLSQLKNITKSFNKFDD